MSAVIGASNLVLGATITAGSQVSSLPGSNVQGPHGSPSTGWQTVAGVTTAASGAFLTIAPTAGAQIWRVMGIFGTNLTTQATVTFQLYNSLGPTLVWSTAVSGPAAGYRQAVAIAPTDVTADYLVIRIDDGFNSDGFINVPLAFAGPGWFPSRGISYASTFGRESSVLETIARGGQEFPVPLWLRRKWPIQFAALTTADLWTNLDPLLIAAHAGINVFFAPDDGSAYLAQEAIFGRLKITSDVSYPFHNADRRQISLTITERL
jgi:hypothetical protein